MKKIVMGILTLLSFALNAQTMNSPKEAIIALFNSTDQQEWSKVQASFAQKVTIDYSSMNGNPPAEMKPIDVINSWKSILPGFSSTHHQLGNFQVTTQGKSAHVFCYGTASHYLENEQGNLWLVVGTYDFELARDDSNTWKISSMKFNFNYQDGNLSLPQSAINNVKE